MASYLKAIGFDKTAYLIGSPGFATELADHGIKTTKPAVIRVMGGHLDSALTILMFSA